MAGAWRMSGWTGKTSHSPPARTQGYSHMVHSVVSTGGPLDFARGKLHAERRPSFNDKQLIVEERSLHSGRSLPRAKSRGPLVRRRKRHVWQPRRRERLICASSRTDYDDLSSRERTVGRPRSST